MKLLHEIKFGQTVYNLLTVNAATTYDQISKSTGLAPKQLQKALTDLCKAGYVMKTDRGYKLTDMGLQLSYLRTADGSETIT